MQDRLKKKKKKKKEYRFTWPHQQNLPASGAKVHVYGYQMSGPQVMRQVNQTQSTLLRLVGFELHPLPP